MNSFAGGRPDGRKASITTPDTEFSDSPGFSKLKRDPSLLLLSFHLVLLFHKYLLGATYMLGPVLYLRVIWSEVTEQVQRG